LNPMVLVLWFTSRAVEALIGNREIKFSDLISRHFELPNEEK